VVSRFLIKNKNICKSTCHYFDHIHSLGRPRTSDFNRCDNRGSDLRRWRFFMGGRALERQSPRTSTESVTSWTARIKALVFALSLRTRNVKKRKKFWVPVTTYGGEFWNLNKDTARWLAGLERRVIIRIFCGIKVNENWRNIMSYCRCLEI